MNVEPKFVTLLADDDGICRWKATICNYDTNYKAIEVLLMMDGEQFVLATRPADKFMSAWGVPVVPERTAPFQGRMMGNPLEQAE